MALMALTWPNLPKKVDRNLAIKMAISHDLAECITGDITPSDNVTKDEKFILEHEAMKKLCENVESETTQLVKLFNEYEDRTSETAKFVKDLDRLEMCVQ